MLRRRHRVLWRRRCRILRRGASCGRCRDTWHRATCWLALDGSGDDVLDPGGDAAVGRGRDRSGKAAELLPRLPRRSNVLDRLTYGWADGRIWQREHLRGLCGSRVGPRIHSAMEPDSRSTGGVAGLR